MKWRDLGTRQAVEQTRRRHSYSSHTQSPYSSSPQQTRQVTHQQPPTNQNSQSNYASSRAQAQPQTPGKLILQICSS